LERKIRHQRVFQYPDTKSLFNSVPQLLNDANNLPIWRPIFKGVRQLPGFKDFVRDLGLVDYWRTSGNWGDFCHPVGEEDFECD
jgi:hypothetical protein